MRHFSIFAFAGLISLTFAINIGYIDLQQTFNDYNKTMAIRADMQLKEDTYNTILADKQKNVDEAKKKNADERTINQMMADIEKDLAPQKQELLELNRQYAQEIQADIVIVVKEVAKLMNVEIVLDKKSIVWGGLDMTQLVIAKLNK